MENRKIIHIDMDAFYASVEQLDFPEYRNKPIAVGGNAERGVIAAASYEARKFGVKSAMSSKMAAKMCPELIFVKPRFSRYSEISKEIRKIFKRYTDLIEPLSLDEAFLDVSENKLNLKSATHIAQSIKNDIKNELNLVASAGVSYNKFLAKMASDEDKPDGLFVIEPKDAIAFLDRLPIHRFFGIGKVTCDKMLDLGVVNGKLLRKLSKEFLIQQFGKSGSYFYNICRGIDYREVENYRERKSIACESTFFTDLYYKEEVEKKATKIASELWERYQKVDKTAKTLSLKLKYFDFTVSSKSVTNTSGFLGKEQVLLACSQLIAQALPLPKPIRLLGYQLSNFLSEEKTSSEKKEQFTQTTLDF